MPRGSPRRLVEPRARRDGRSRVLWLAIPSAVETCRLPKRISGREAARTRSARAAGSVYPLPSRLEPGPDGTRRQTPPKSEAHAVGGERHLRAHGRSRLCRAVLRRRAHGRRGRRPRGAPRGSRPRDARGVRARGPLAARRRRDVERAARAVGDRAHGQRRRRHRPHRHPPARHPGRAGRRPRRRRRGVAPRAGAGRLRAREPHARRRSSFPSRSACASSRSVAARTGSSTPTATTR